MPDDNLQDDHTVCLEDCDSLLGVCLNNSPGNIEACNREYLDCQRACDSSIGEGKNSGKEDTMSEFIPPDLTPTEYDRCAECLVQCETALDECINNKIAASVPEDKCELSYRDCTDACEPAA